MLDDYKYYIERENELATSALAKHEAALDLTLRAIKLLRNFVPSLDSNQGSFLRFASQLDKHLILSLESATRLHRMQARMNQRICHEAILRAAYSLAHPYWSKGKNIIEKKTDEDMFDAAVKWVKLKYENHSESLLEAKSLTSDKMVHSNLYPTFLNISESQDATEISFFDRISDKEVEIEILLVGGAAVFAAAFFIQVNDDYRGLNLKADLIVEAAHLTTVFSEL